MGITDFISDFMASMSFVQDVHAEAPAEEEEEESKDEGESEEKEEGGDDEAEGGDDTEDGGDDEEEEEEEEEDDEPVDPKPQIEENCARSSQCSGYKHHYEECVERVTAQHEDEDYKGPKEDCVEEFFHLQHCVTSCAAPKLFKLLK